ncbi:MAG: CcdB family protein [Rhizomicrobium sp.]
MTRQFDVYRNPLRGGREQRPYLLVVQHGLFADRPTRVVVPLVVAAAIRPERRLNPSLRVLGKPFYLSPTEIITLPIRHLRDHVDNLESERDRIVAALDVLLTGI